jgi:hypothetical protein
MAAVTSEHVYSSSSNHNLKLTLDVTKFEDLKIQFEAHAYDHGFLELLNGTLRPLEEKPKAEQSSGRITNQAAITAYELEEARRRRLDAKCWNALVQLCKDVKDSIPRKFASDKEKCQKTWADIQSKVRNGQEANDKRLLLQRFHELNMPNSGDILKDFDEFTEAIDLIAGICITNGVAISDEAKILQLEAGLLPEFDKIKPTIALHEPEDYEESITLFRSHIVTTMKSQSLRNRSSSSSVSTKHAINEKVSQKALRAELMKAIESSAHGAEIKALYSFTKKGGKDNSGKDSSGGKWKGHGDRRDNGGRNGGGRNGGRNGGRGRGREGRGQHHGSGGGRSGSADGEGSYQSREDRDYYRDRDYAPYKSHDYGRGHGRGYGRGYGQGRGSQRGGWQSRGQHYANAAFEDNHQSSSYPSSYPPTGRSDYPHHFDNSSDAFWSGPVHQGRMAKIILDQASTDCLRAFVASGLAVSNFFIDSAASATLSNEESLFVNTVPDRTPICMANGAVVWTVAKGDIDCGSLGLLKGCFYAPDLQFNLLSVPHLNLTTGLVVCFDVPYCFVMDRSGQNRINIGQFEQGMFVAPLPRKSLPRIAAASMVHAMPARVVPYGQLIHQRFVHMSDRYLYAALRYGLVTGLKLPVRPSQFTYPFCAHCALAKSCRVSSHRTPGSTRFIAKQHAKRQKKADKTIKSADSPSDSKPIASDWVDDSSDDDCPTLAQVLHGPDRDKWIQAMLQEQQQLAAQDAFTFDGAVMSEDSKFPPTLPMFKAVKAWAPLSYLSWDLKGPITPRSLGRARYILFGVCQVSRYRLVFFLKKKKDTTKNLSYRANKPFLQRISR